MTNAASAQGVEVLREKLREFVESSETGRRAVEMGAGVGVGGGSGGVGRVGGRKGGEEEIEMRGSGRDFEGEDEI